MTNEATCLKCGAPLTGDARGGFCPKCLFKQATAGDSDDLSQASQIDPSGTVATGLPLPRTFGDYELLEEIARGGMGIVYMRLLVFGNSGSGKSTFARQFASRHNLNVLDLDHVVWSRTEFATFRPDEEIIRELDAFVAANLSWVVEGCYGRWMEHLRSHCAEKVFLNPGEAACLASCQARPWEPEKYPSQAEQDAKLPFLLDWVRGYYSRTDDMSLSAHRRLFESFHGAKQEIGATELSDGSPRSL